MSPGDDGRIRGEAPSSGGVARPWGPRLQLGRRERLLRVLPERQRRDLLFLQSQGRFPRHRKPRTLMEKVNWRIVHDRRPSLGWTCDKLATKDFATACSLVRVPRTYWSGEDLSELTDVDLPAHWVLKPNSASGLIYEGGGRVGPSEVAELRALTHDWYPPATYTELCEWAYTQVRPVLFVEEFVGESTPVDYKFFVFDGEPRIVQVDTDRFTSHRMSFYTPDWVMLPAHSRFPLGSPLARPEHLEQMLDAARMLVRDLEFLRVDLYDVGGEVWFGELSPYPGSGLMKISPSKYDAEWGDWWTLPDLPR